MHEQARKRSIMRNHSNKHVSSKSTVVKIIYPFKQLICYSRSDTASHMILNDFIHVLTFIERKNDHPYNLLHNHQR